MKIKKLISSALTIVLLLGAILAVVTVSASAVCDSTSATANLSSEQIKEVVNASLDYEFETAEEMLAYELSLGYLDSMTTADKKFSMYVNRYTGLFYYVNNVTGQILTSNPSNVKEFNNGSVAKLLMSQISIEYIVNATNKENTDFNSTEWAALYSQINTSFISNGIRVNYTLGDTTTRFLLPGRILAEDYEELVIKPMLLRFETLLETHLRSLVEGNPNFSFFNNSDYEPYEYDCISSKEYKRYVSDMVSLAGDYYGRNSAELKEIKSVQTDILAFSTMFSLKNPKQYEETGKTDSATYKNMIKFYYTPQEGVSANLDIYNSSSDGYHAPMYVFKESAVTAEKRANAARWRKYCPSYTFSEMFASEKECGYVDDSEQKPVFRCSLEYSFNEDGTLSVRLPSNSITFDETVYSLKEIRPIQFFGAGNVKNDGYIFFPDGSGTIVDFNDFNDYTFTTESAIYGNDYAYSALSDTSAHREQVTMPVFGVVNSIKANALTSSRFGTETVTNGYFAILEEGASLAKLGYMGGGSHSYAGAYSVYTPYPMDTYDLSETIGVGGSGAYTIVAETRYNGSYVTKIVMLTDDTVGKECYGNNAYYSASYVGMAACYRDYLKAGGYLSALENISKDLPLYIEALGAMDITTKILSFPVTQTIPLTSFDDVLTMYNEISNNKDTFLKKAEEYEALALEVSETSLKESYLKTAEGYRAMAETAKSIENINFRLTGFANGGMHFTYPAKVRWERACGGKDAFDNLLNEAKKLSDEGKNLGIYPDFDFIYINNTELFDGVSNNKNVSRMVDNRFASKQEYDAVLQEYVTYYTLVVNPATFEELYGKFLRKYSAHAATGISVSTMGSDLNSNFDEEDLTNRSEAEAYVTSILAKMKNEQGYEIMVDKGNSYTYKYVRHIIGAATDSSHYRYSSYAVPFLGMVLHGYVNYTGDALNYAGTPQYYILRAIENGAAPYYVLCYQNTGNLKDDVLLSKYYGVDYNTWFDSIVTTYGELNAAIGGLQKYNITDHKIILGERAVDENEQNANYAALKAEIIAMLDAQIAEAVRVGYEYLQNNEASSGRPLAVSIDTDALIAQFCDILNLTAEELVGTAEKPTAFKTEVDGVVAKYEAEYPSGGTNPYVVSFSAIEYESQYSYITESLATDGKNYVYTDYTSDINNIAMVTYSNGTDSVTFILNYNIYSVTVKLGDGETYTIGKYDYVKID